jgi:hypothetical protein
MSPTPDGSDCEEALRTDKIRLIRSYCIHLCAEQVDTLVRERLHQLRDCRSLVTLEGNREQVATPFC